MKILVLTPRVPYPPKDGGAIAMFNMCKGLAENGVTLDLFSYNTSKHFVPNPDKIEELSFFNEIHTVDINNKLSPLVAFLNLFQTRSYNTARFITKKVEKALINWLKQNSYDFIQCEVLFGALYAPLLKEYAPQTKLVYRAHNIEYKIWQRLAEQASGFKKWYLNLMSRRLKKEEESLIPVFDHVIPISQVDEKWFLGQGVKNLFVTPTGVDHFLTYSENTECKIGFLGSLDWQPNIEGVEWFLSSVWSKVIAAIPHARFEIAGRNCPKSFDEFNTIKGVKVVGEVSDASQFITSNTLMVVPLLSGSGMRIKIIEGLALSMPIVSTSVGCEGISLRDNQEILVANDTEDFAQKVITLCYNNRTRKQIAIAGHDFVFERYANTSLTKKLVTYYETIQHD